MRLRLLAVSATRQRSHSQQITSSRIMPKVCTLHLSLFTIHCSLLHKPHILLLLGTRTNSSSIKLIVSAFVCAKSKTIVYAYSETPFITHWVRSFLHQLIAYAITPIGRCIFFRTNSYRFKLIISCFASRKT